MCQMSMKLPAMFDQNPMVAHLGHITAMYIFFVIPSERKCDFVFPSKN